MQQNPFGARTLTIPFTMRSQSGPKANSAAEALASNGAPKEGDPIKDLSPDGHPLDQTR